MKTPRPERDRQRQAIYEAENQVARIMDRSAEFPVIEVASSRLTLPPERHFASLDSVQRYVDEVLRLGWVQSAWPEHAARSITVRERRGTTKAHYEYGAEDTGSILAIPIHGRDARWALRELVVLHEIAHHLGEDGEASHGKRFVNRLLSLADGVIGPEVALLLRVALADQQVSLA